jgi:uncharacterized protein YegJ (DUF2314 family)
MSDQVFFASGENPKMLEAFEKARQTFKYFWRELYWEYRRIIPALDVACAKVMFQQPRDGDTPLVEHMWINEVEYDGEKIYGVLVNDPHELTNIKNGDAVAVSLEELSDWLFASAGKTCGGFTIQAMRSEMDDNERAEHDAAWGMDFGDYNEVLVVRDQKKESDSLTEHPMSRNMKEEIEKYTQQHPEVLTDKDPQGNTLLHREAIAGNRTSVEVLLQAGAHSNEKNNLGKTALDYARQLNWVHLVPLLGT